MIHPFNVRMDAPQFDKVFPQRPDPRDRAQNRPLGQVE